MLSTGQTVHTQLARSRLPMSNDLLCGGEIWHCSVPLSALIQLGNPRQSKRKVGDGTVDLAFQFLTTDRKQSTVHT
jgi:hypothetical protein